jgi:dihydrofolate synthase/folylpolyglutamate synthase
VDLADALAYLAEHENLEATAGRVHGLSLDRMRRLVGVLGDPQDAAPVVHITGTNGKGSTARFTSALLAETGLTVGTYSSPHLQRLNERIARNGESIDDDSLGSAVGDIAAVEPMSGVEPSYFEIVTAAAFRWFAEIAVDVVVLEVGLLGRYDATNVADGIVAVVTNVGHDHTDYQGDWRRRIAEEKAGIIKPGATLVLGETSPDLVPVFEAEPHGDTLLRGVHFGCDSNDVAVGGRLLDVRTPAGVLEDVFLPLHGAHQGDNAALAIAAAEAFFGRGMDADVVRDALAGVTMPGRFEVVGHSPLLVLDCAHNPEGAAAAALTLDDDFTFDGRVILVVGMLQPRDPYAVLEAFEVGNAGLVIACTPPSPRGIPAEEVARAVEPFGLPVEAVPDVGAAVDRALDVASADDAILVTGSLFVVGAARTHLGL